MASKSQINAAATQSDAWLKAQQKQHITMVQNSMKKLQKNILNSLNILDMDDAGNLAGIKANLGAAQKLHVKIEKLFYSDFNNHTRKLVKDFKKANTDIISNFKTIGETAEFTGLDETMGKVLRDGYYKDFLGISETAKQKVVQSMYDNVLAGGKFSDLESEIRQAILGSAAKGVVGASLAQYARLYARDMIMNYHNEVMLKKADDLGMDTFIYSGTIMGKTRRFCRRRAGNPYTRKEINSWKYSWQGKSGPAMTHRGGYNCRHHWQPVRKEWLDDQEQSMLDKLWKLDKKGNPLKKAKPLKTKPLKTKPVKPVSKPKPKPEPSVAWEPKMSEEKINLWSKNSINKTTYYQGTTASAAEKIGKEGLEIRDKKLSGTNFGKGIFLTNNDTAKEIAKKIGSQGRLVKAKVNVSKIKKIQDWETEVNLAKKKGFDFLDTKKGSQNIADYYLKEGYDGIDLHGLKIPGSDGLLIFNKTKVASFGEIVIPKKVTQKTMAAQTASDTTELAVKEKFEKDYAAKLKEIKWVREKDSFTIDIKDPVYQNFRIKEDAVVYGEKKAMYKELFTWAKKNNPFEKGWEISTTLNINLTQDLLRKNYLDHMPKIYNSISSWQTSTNTTSAMALRVKYTQLEKSGDASKLIWKSAEAKKHAIQDVNELIPTDQYLEFRAMNQAYLEVNGVQEVTLYRGTDGRTGKKIKNSITEPKNVNRTSFPIEDRQLAGYTTSKSTGGKFGARSGGITIRQNFKRQEVIVHADLFKGATGSFIHEKEFIVFSQRRNVDVVDMWWQDKGFGKNFIDK